MARQTKTGADGRLMLNLADIEKQLGVYLSARFIEIELGIPRDGQIKASILWEQRSVPAIRRALMNYLQEQEKTDV